MSKRTLLELAAIGLTLLVPSKARAQSQFFFDDYCVTGSFSACASVRVNASADQKTITMQVWNLNGVMGDTHTITAIGLYHIGASWSGSVNSVIASYVTPGDSTNVSSYWKPKYATDIKTLGGVDVAFDDGTKGNNGIVGCTDPEGGTHWSTCASFPGKPYMRFTFNLSQTFSLDNLALRWHSQQLPDGSSLKCDTGGAGDYGPCGPPSVVPEPVTIALLGTGLVGMGAARLRRRKKDGDIESA